MTVLALPLFDDAGVIAIIAFLGGFSAATAMVIVDSVAVAVMISNHLVMPIVLRRRAFAGVDLGGFVIGVRRVSIVRRHPARLCLLPRIRRSGARVDRPSVLRRHRADRAGLPRRADLVARHGARRQRRARRRVRHLGLHAASPEPRLGRRVLVRRGRHRTLRHRGAQADLAVRASTCRSSRMASCGA